MTTARIRLWLGTISCLLTGCAPLLGETREPAYQGNGSGGLYSAGSTLIFQDSAGPLSYRSTGKGSGPGRPVRGEACQSAITLPFGLLWAAVDAGSLANAPAFLGVGWRDGGYGKAVASANASAPGSQLIDVRADLHTKIVLGIWRQQCVEVTATAVPFESQLAPRID